MFIPNIQYIAGGLALFFISIAVYKWLSQKASKNASAAKSLEQSHVGQDSGVEFHNPFPNGAPIPMAPPPSDEKPQPPPAPPAAAPAAAQAAPAPAASSDKISRQAAPPAPTPPEQIYKWN
jgi:hypothetical protein